MPLESARTLLRVRSSPATMSAASVAFRDLSLRHDLGQGLRLHRQPGQLLADVVMQVLSDASLLCVGDRQQLLLQRFSLRDVVHDAREKTGGNLRCNSLKARSMGNVDPSSSAADHTRAGAYVHRAILRCSGRRVQTITARRSKSVQGMSIFDVLADHRARAG